MSENAFQPTVYLKQNCPFCMKVRIALLEAGLGDTVQTRNFVPGEPEEDAIRAELAPHLEKVTFPTAQLTPGQYVTESDDIVASLCAIAGTEPSAMPVLTNYLEGPFASMMRLYRENSELKKAVENA